MSPETGQETFLKAKIAVSEVLRRQRFNTAVFCGLMACTKRDLKKAVFKMGERPILWQEQVKGGQTRGVMFQGNVAGIKTCVEHT